MRQASPNVEYFLEVWSKPIRDVILITATICCVGAGALSRGSLPTCAPRRVGQVACK